MSSSSAPSSSSAYHSQTHLDLQLDSSSVGSLSSASLGEPLTASETATVVAHEAIDQCHESAATPQQPTEARDIVNLLAAVEASSTISDCGTEGQQMLEVEVVERAAEAAIAFQDNEAVAAAATVRALEAQHETQLQFSACDEDVAASLSFAPCDAPAAILAVELEQGANRLERSNSCSQAETCGGAISLLAARTSALASSSQSIGGVGTTTDATAAGSVSQENLTVCCDEELTLEQASPAATSPPIACPKRLAADQDISLGHLSSASCSPPRSALNPAAEHHFQRPAVHAATNSRVAAPAAVAQSSSSSSSSRFFSSKLNTGSLWSLLSAGSSTSMNAINEISTISADCAQLGQQQSEDQDSTPSGTASKQLRELKTRSANFFNQFKPKSSSNSNQQEFAPTTATSQPMLSSSLSSDQSPRRRRQQQQQQRLAPADCTPPAAGPKYRFSVKYIGSAMLHKNFTLPMLEWIVKDVKRQTSGRVTGSGTFGQRQFTIPVREIMLEMQTSPSLRLTAIACKDGHAIFVHPMHCVSKYAQLQHDSSSFAYIIRDSKEAPSFCHVFQAKSASRVHEIFSAIREVTTRTQLLLHTANSSLTAAHAHTSQLLKPSTTGLSTSASASNASNMASAATGHVSSAANKLQKSASTDGHWRSLLGPTTTTTTPKLVAATPKQLLAAPKSPPLGQANPEQQQQEQFENSYQFEVMFVKRVKLSCRRVPPSFVDDALETLKTFEVPKTTNQIKGGVTKRIISASVDERQEYDQEHCQSPTSAESSSSVGGVQQVSSSFQEEQRRGSSASLRQQSTSGAAAGMSPGGRMAQRASQESKSCQQSPVKLTKASPQQRQEREIQFANGDDFSPYNTITSSDLNERIAAIPVVSSSVSLDHETRQKLARRVRETIMATAANMTSKEKIGQEKPPEVVESDPGNKSPAHSRRASASASCLDSAATTTASAITNNFDVFRRGSARQVVKNRTMLLVIGKDELAAISIDKHQMLFSKTFSSIVHCLQGIKNKDHFGLICRDSGKINPQTESYAGFVFKCQSDKVVREIMGALKQVIYSSQHNYHGYYSPYNPLNSLSQQAGGAGGSIQSAFNANASRQREQVATSRANVQKISPSSCTSPSCGGGGLVKTSETGESQVAAKQSADCSQQVVSLAAKRGFANPIEFDDQTRAQKPTVRAQPPTAPAGGGGGASMSAAFAAASQLHAAPPTKNPIKSMFCDDCPLYWYHRLCCDVESLPAEASKAIILRRIDSSLGEREQDEVFTKFSEFKIESIDEHNEIFMSILRHLSERKQLRHGQAQAHLNALAKNASLIRKQSSDVITSGSSVQRQSSLASLRCTISAAAASTTTSALPATTTTQVATSGSAIRGHQRSGSSGGSLAFVQEMTSTDAANNSLLALDNLKRAKNSFSASIENMLKRRPSLSDLEAEREQQHHADEQRQRLLIVGARGDKGALSRSSSFMGQGRDVTSGVDTSGGQLSPPPGGDGTSSATSGNLKRSQSTSDYSRTTGAAAGPISWRDSLTRTLNNADDLTNPLVSFFKRRGSLVPADQQDQTDSKRTSTESLLHANGNTTLSGQHSPSRYNQRNASGHSTPSNLLSGSFWKKSIFDKIQKTSPTSQQQQQQPERAESSDNKALPNDRDNDDEPREKRTREELRVLWKKAILEQITLLKMDKQNQKLLRNSDKAGHNQQQQQQQQQEPSENRSNSLQRAKLNYRDVPYAKEAEHAWTQLLKQDPTRKVQFVEVARHVRLGLPKQCRGEVWMFLMNQYQLRHGTSFQPAECEFQGDANQTYRSLLSQLSTQQHEIFVDIGRTFPSHPYYSRYLSIGQLSLFNLLKAYSLLDPEVGYCQGLSFVAGILLLHVDSEDEAFELMRHLMFNFGLRKQYLPSMDALHLQLYQMTRLLRDHEFVIFDHFDRHDISPSLYAAPWFLTLFASQFPLGFVARLLDLIYLVGIEAIFRVSLNLLAYHRKRLLDCTSLELTMDFMRAELIKIDDSSLVQIFDQALGLDLRNKLIEYEIEYSFYCADDKARSSSSSQNHHHLYHYTGGSQSTSSWARLHSSANSSSSTVNQDLKQRVGGSCTVSNTPQEELALQCEDSNKDPTNSDIDSNSAESATIGLTSEVADATATVIIQHLLANNHLRSLRSNYSY